MARNRILDRWAVQKYSIVWLSSLCTFPTHWVYSSPGHGCRGNRNQSNQSQVHMLRDTVNVKILCCMLKSCWRLDLEEFKLQIFLKPYKQLWPGFLQFVYNEIIYIRSDLTLIGLMIGGVMLLKCWFTFIILTSSLTEKARVNSFVYEKIIWHLMKCLPGSPMNITRERWWGMDLEEVNVEHSSLFFILLVLHLSSSMFSGICFLVNFISQFVHCLY